MVKKQVKKKIVSKSKQIDFDFYALPSQSTPVQSGGIRMDGTSIPEISITANKKYSQEIIGNVRKSFNLTKLQKLKNTNVDKYLNEGKKQIDTVWKGLESLMTHTHLFNVAFLICMGLILNDIEKYFGKKSKYTGWIKDNFGYKKMRYFQQAKQLARMGDFAKANTALGKNRLLEFDRLEKEESLGNDDILNSHPFEDITADFDGVVFRIHVDAIITLHRFNDAEIEILEYDQAFLAASILGKSIPVNIVKKIHDQLDKQEEQENKKRVLDDIIMNKMVFPSEDTIAQKAEESLNKLLSNLIKYNDHDNIEDETWVEDQKEEISEDIIIQAHALIMTLADKFEIDLSVTTTTTK